MSNRRCHRHLGRHFELQQRASTVGGNETCVCVVKYRWQIDRLKILQALLGIFCAKIPFFFCCVLFTSSTLDVIQFLHSTFVYSLNIYASVLVLFSLCISHMVIIDTYIVFDCSLFLILLFFLLSSFAVRWVWWNFQMRCGGKCVIVVVRARCCQRRSRSIVLWCTRTPRTQTSERVAAIQAWSMNFCICVCGWKQIKQSFSTGFLCFIFNV